MFVVNDDLSIYATRGDIVCLNVSATDDSTGGAYEFQPGDIVRMKIFGKKDAESIYLSKDFPVVAKTYAVGVMLTEQDTKIGDVISKPMDYWYEIELNPYTNPQTIVGYDEDGAKVFKLFPEGKDLVDEPTEPEDIPVVDKDLDLTSPRPVENRAIARAVTLLKNDLETVDKRLTGKIKENKTATKELNEALLVERARIDNLLTGATAEGSEVVDIRVGADGHVYGSAGTAVRATAKNVFELLEATKLAQPIIPFMDRLEVGFVQIETGGLTYKEYSNYVRTKEGVTIHLEKGDKITCSNETRVYAGYLANGSYVQIPWTSNFVAPATADYVLLFSDYEIDDIASLEGFLSNITISRAVNYSSQIDSLRHDTDHLLQLENTYLSKCELAVGDATTTNAMRYSAKLDSPVYGLKITMPDTVKYGIQGYSDSVYTKKTYDSGWRTDEGFIVLENPDLHYVVLFIRSDETKPTAEDRANTTVLQSLSLTAVLDKLNAYSSASTLVYYDSTNDMIRSVAHRGLSDSAPENTVPAFVMAKQAGFTYVETDIQVTKDGKYVCVHDATISKYTSGKNTGAVADYTLDELQAMDFGAWKDEKWTGTKILTFEEFVLLCKKLGLKPYIELKYTHSEADVAYYLAYVKKMGIADACVWRGAAYNSNIRALSDTAVLAYDASSIMTEDRVKSIVERYAPLFFHNDASYVTEEIVELCHSHGVRIEVYTVNDENALEAVAAMGVDGITTDKLLAGKVLFNNLL